MWLQLPVVYTSSFPSGAHGKESACQIQETQEIKVRSLGWEDPRIGNSTPVQYSCLENFVGRGARRATIHEVTKTEQ